MARWIIAATFFAALAIVGGMAGFTLLGHSDSAPGPSAAAIANQGELPAVDTNQPAAENLGGTGAAKAAPAAGFADILANRSGDIAAWRLDSNPNIVILDYPDLASQGQALNRVAALIEKAEVPRDHVLSESELASYIEATGSHASTFFYGHDYKASDLARFFTLAREKETVLRPAEENLLSRLRVERFLIEDGTGGYRAPTEEKALVSVVQVRADDPATAVNDAVDESLRETIFRHELSHGEFFTNQAYRTYCERFWREDLSTDERLTFRVFLNTAGYDPGNETIMVNEMQAFMMNTSDGRAFSAGHLGVDPAVLEDLRRRFLAGDPPTALFGPEHPVAGPLLATKQ